jgi:hypothetical protein
VGRETERLGVLTGLLEGIIPVRDPAKATFGRGVDMMTYGVQVSSLLNDAPSRAGAALAAYQWSPYIRQAERAIKNRLSTIEWWLEDEDGERITDESPPQYIAIRDGIEMPYRPDPDEPESASPKTRAGLWDITLRHMGCAGYGFWYLDNINGFGVPTQTLYINPARLTPYLTDGGQLAGWVLDARSRNPIKFERKEMILFPLEAADEGFLPTGLVHTVLAKAELSRMADRHASMTLHSGGRRPGIYHPPAGGSIPDDVYENLKRDLRNIVEVPDSVKRSMILKGPVEFDPTDSTMSEMQMLDVLSMTRDDILATWGVPPSQVGYKRESTIGGSADDLDAETMWRNAAGPRMATFAEILQTQYLDRYAALPQPIVVTFKYEEPEFDDDAPLYEMAQKAAGVPMRASERRALINLEPFGDPALDNAIHLPINIVEVGAAPALDPGDMGKAKLASNVIKLRTALDKFLRDQAERIGRKLEANAAHLMRNPPRTLKDIAAWWDQDEEDDKLMRVLRPYIVDAAVETGEASRARVRGKAVSDTDMESSLLAATLRRLGRRVTDINKTTRDRIRDLTVEALDVGMSPADLGRALRGVVPPLEGDLKAWEPVINGADATFASELRGETIARTELRVAQNAAQIDSFAALGSERLEVLDGDGDPECAARDGQIVSMDEAENMMLAEHPNGTLTFAPVV